MEGLISRLWPEGLNSYEVIVMPKSAKKKRKRGDGPMPSGGAGLIRFFEDETPGIKIGPTMVIVVSAILIVVTVVAHIFGPQL